MKPRERKAPLQAGFKCQSRCRKLLLPTISHIVHEDWLVPSSGQTSDKRATKRGMLLFRGGRNMKNPKGGKKQETQSRLLTNTGWFSPTRRTGACISFLHVKLGVVLASKIPRSLNPSFPL